MPAHHQRRTTIARSSFGDPGYWDDVISLMTPSVSVNLGPESLASLAIGGVLVLGHSWESIEASRGWRSAKARKEKVEAANATTATSSSSTAAAGTTKKPRTTAAAKPMTKAEREAAVAEAKAERAAELNRRRADPPQPVDECEIVVCTNNACAKRGARELKAEIAAREKELGKQHPDVAVALTDLAALHSEEEQFAAAQPLYERALRIQERTLGAEHQDTVQTLTDLAICHLDQTHNEVGRPLLERALVLQEQALGPDHPDVEAIRDVLHSLDADDGV